MKIITVKSDTNVIPYNNQKWICGIVKKLAKYDMLSLYGYKPNDNYNMSNVDEEFATVCNGMVCMIKHIILHFCLIGGNMNTDFRRSNAHSKWMQAFNERNNLLNIWNLQQIIPHGTFVRSDFSAKSRIDHIYFSLNLEQHVYYMTVLKVHDNSSWHRPLCLTLDMEDILEPMTYCIVEPQDSKAGYHQVAWHRVKETHTQSTTRDTWIIY